jgi:hypothetical protein
MAGEVTSPVRTPGNVIVTSGSATPGVSEQYARADHGPHGSGGGGVTSFNARTGAVVPVSGDYTVAQVTGAAPLASPALTGVPTAPTAAPLTDNTQLATTAYTDSAVAASVTSFNTRTGAVVPASGDYSVAQVTGAAPLASPALTGTPTAPTAAGGTNTTQIATTAFVTAALSAGVTLGGDVTGPSGSNTIAAIAGVALVGGIIQLASLPVSVAVQTRSGSGAPTVLTTDQAGDSYWDYTNAVMYANLQGSPITAGQPWTTAPNTANVSDLLTTATGLSNPMTTAGDIIIGGASGVPARLAAGTAAYVLTSNGPGTAPSWQASSGGGFANPMTTEGDLIYGGASGVATRLAAGTAGYVLTTQGSSAAPTWTAALTNPMTTAGDMIVGGGSGAPTRMALGATYDVLFSIGGAPAWNPIFSSVGALLYGAASNVPTQLAIGSTGQALIVSGGLPVWGQPSLLPTGAIISTPVTMTAATAVTMFTTTSLAIGTWEVTASGLLTAPASTSATGLEVYPGASGTAVYTVTGPASGEIGYQLASANIPFSFTFVIVVTTAGTVNFVGYNNSASNATLQSSTQGTSAKTGVSGWSAVRIK